ncbi:MAG: tape measure protein [Actinomycetaceae bacterium]|nr:tape measure protein [Actinomycetaceae bacterium]
MAAGANGLTLGTAWLQISPSFRNMGKDVSRAMAHVEGSAGKAGERAGSRLRRGMMTRLAGLGATIAAVAGFRTLASEAIAASDATDKFKATLKFAGLDKGIIDKLAKSTRKYADQTIYDLKDIQTMTAQLGANGVKDFDKIAVAAGNLNAIAGGNKETYRALGLAITQISGAGKLMTQDWNQIVNAIPGASGKLQEAMRKNGAFTGDFREAMAKGQITAEEFNQALLELGMDDTAKKAATSTSTIEGSWENLKAAMVGGMADILTKIKPALTGFMNWVTNKSDTFFSAFTSGFSTVVDVLGAAFRFVAANRDWLVPLAVGLVAGAQAFKLATAAAALFNVVMAANPIVLVVAAIAALAAGLVYFFTKTETGRALWKSFTDFLHSAWEGLKSAWDATWRAVQAVWQQVISPVVSAIVSAFQTAWPVLSSVFSSIASTISGVVAGAFDVLKTIVTTAWNVIKTVVTTAWGIISPVFNAIVTVVKGPLSLSFEALKLGVSLAWNVIKAAATVAWAILSTIFTTMANIIRTVVVTAWEFLRGIISTAWDVIKTAATTAWGILSSVFSSIVNVIGGVVTGAFNTLKTVVTTVWNAIKTTITTIWNAIVSVLSTVASKVHDLFVKPFQNAADSISKAWSKIKEWMATPVNWVIEHVINNGVIAFINSILGALGLNKSKIGKVGKIKGYARGGRAGRGWAIVGEEGPELVNFTNPGRVYTAAQTAEAITMAGRDIHPTLIPDRQYTPSEAMLAAKAVTTQDPKLLQAALGNSPSQALLPIGGFLGSFGKWVSDTWDGVTEFVADIGGKAIKFVRGRLADAARAVINPLQGLVRKHVSGFWQDLFVGAGDKLIDFIAGVDKDTKEIKIADFYADAAGMLNSQQGTLLMRPLSGGVSRPLAGGRLTSPFGVGRYGGMHSGIDLAAPTGTPVYAYRDGIVTRAGWNSLAGRSGIGIVLAHAGGMGSYYGHLSAALVAAGAQVKAGQQIGRVGSTGRSTGPHLHWEISLGGNPQRVVNPMPYLKYDSGGWLRPGVNVVTNQTRRPEPVFTAAQWDTMATLASAGASNSLAGTRLHLVLEDGRELRGYVREQADQALATSARDLAGRRR